MDIESPQVIEQQMEETRQSLSEKVSLLENQVVDTVKNTTQAVQDTVESVKSAVQETVSAVKDTVQDSVATVTENVKDTFDVKQQIERNPLTVVGAAALAGLVTGLLVFRKSEKPAVVAAPLAYPPDFDDAALRPAVRVEAPPSRPGFFDELLSMAGVEGKQLAREAVNQASQTIRQHVMPALMSWMTQNIETAFARPGAPAWQRNDGPSSARM